MPGDKSVPWVSSKVVHSQGREWYNWNFFHSTTPTQVIDQSQNSTVVHEWSQRSDRTSGGINDHVDKYKVSSNKPQKLKPCLACALTMIGYWERIKEASGWQDDWTPGVWNAQCSGRDGWMKLLLAVLHNNGLSDGWQNCHTAIGVLVNTSQVFKYIECLLWAANFHWNKISPLK